MRTARKLLAIALVLIMVAVTAESAVAKWAEGPAKGGESQDLKEEVPAPFRELKGLVDDLKAATTDHTDGDGDGLPDTVERVIGTDPGNPDSDFDRVPDQTEVDDGMDPSKADSNGDGLGDWFEVNSGSLDLDGDGVPNAWDWDNDGDGINDDVDMSPDSRTSLDSSFHFDVMTSGAPLSLYFQLRPSNPDHMRLVNQMWDWPYDAEGSMRDLDNSVDDITVAPLLLLTGSEIPSDDALSEYGLQAQGGTVYMPLYPVWDYGNVVALKAQMFFPSCATRSSLSIDISLKWKVTGQTDSVVKALRYSNGYHLSAADDGPVKVNATDVRDAQSLGWVDLGSGRVGMVAQNGRYLSVGNDGIVRASAMELLDDETFTLAGPTGGTYALKAHNGRFLTVKPDGRVMADAIDEAGGGRFTLMNMAPRPTMTTLAFYADSFMLTGCFFEEYHGTDVGVFWTGSQRDSLAMGLMMAYNYLHNATRGVADIVGMLAAEGIPNNNSVRSFERTDLAMQALATQMLPGARDALPAGQAFPVMTAMMESQVTIQMTNMSGGGNLASDNMVADLASLPVVVSKNFKSNWFERGADEEEPLEEIIVGMRSWGLEEQELVTLMGLTIAWNAGQKTIVKVGPRYEKFVYAEIDQVGPSVKSIMKGGISGLKGLATVIRLVESVYACVQFVKLAPFAKPVLSSMSGVKSGIKMFQASYKTAQSAKTGWLGTMNKACKWLAIIGFVIDVAFAIYCLYEIGEAYGWTQVGTGIAVLYAVMMIVYAIVLIAIGQIPIVGWILALIIALSDAIVGWITGKGWSQWLMEAIIDAITDFEIRSQPDMMVNDTVVTIDDKDGNNLDVGDRISYTDFVIGWVNITEDGSYQDLVDSYITPYLEVTVPSNSSSLTGRATTKIGTDVYSSTSKRTEYNATGWAEPGTAMVNYPMTVCLKADYRAYYDECWWIIFYGWDCNRESKTDTISTDPSTVYFDVMPGTIGEFATWTGVVSRDHDWDGINDTDEVTTDPWKWDTDADGLADGLEGDLGTDPAKFDTDGDGLDDKKEVQLRLNPLSRDSDADGLEDYFEHSGWVVYFDYCGKAFDWYINSDPALNNTEGDLLNDYEEYVCLLNPRSSDTDGNGMPDDIRDYYRTSFEFRYYLAEAGKPYSIVVDKDGNLFTVTPTDLGFYRYIVRWKPDGTSSLFVDLASSSSAIRDLATDASGNIYALDWGYGIFKFSPAGALLGTYGRSGTFQLVNPQGIALDAVGNMYVTDMPTATQARVMVFDKTGAYLRQFGSYGTGDGQLNNPSGICLDADGDIYVVDQGNSRVQLFHNNGTFVVKWGSAGTGTGQFRTPTSVAVDPNGDVLAVDMSNNRVQKFNETGRWIKSLGQLGNGDGEFNLPTDIVFDKQGEFYVSDTANYRVQKFGQRVEFIKAEPRYPFTDTDGDGVGDVLERTERTIVIVSTRGIAGIQMLNVTSDPNVADTDGDGVDDGDEHNMKTDPRSPDTDMDGLTDLEERALGTNLTHYDTDLDGLEDGIERTFKSDPLKADSDADGLDDSKEFSLGTDPSSDDTDRDGLKDPEEVAAGSDPNGPDTDADGVFDGFELDIGTRPTLHDNDGDGLIDGYELFYATDPRSDDSDDDGLGDKFEVGVRLDPLSNDTDEDGLGDAREVELGLNPLSRDSDGDRILDGLDTDFEVVLPEGVIVAADDDDLSTVFAAMLGNKVRATEVTPAELLASHKDARYIVIVGDPAGNDGTAGALIRTLLADSGDMLDSMLSSYDLRIVMRFGIWTAQQTIVLVSNPQPSDAIRVVGMLKSMRATVAGATIEYQYMNERSCFWFDEVDLVKLTDVSLNGKLDEMAEFNVRVSRFDERSTPQALDLASGLDVLYRPTGRYVEVDFSDNVLSPERDILTGMELTMYYTAADLDLTGDGDGDDDGDIDESTLVVYWYNATSVTWERLDTDLPWVFALELNTTDVDLYGAHYAGSILMKVAHASLFGQAGLPKGFVPTVARAPPARTVYVSEEVVLDGSASSGNGALNYTWTFRYRLGRVTLWGAVAEFVFDEPGDYPITLTVLDSLGATDSTTTTVAVMPVTDRKFTLQIGPVIDELGSPVEGVRARLSLATLTFVKPTGMDGFAQLELSESFIGRPVALKLTKNGYQTVEYQTNITPGKALETPPPTLLLVRVPTVARAGDDFQTNVGLSTQFDGSDSEGNVRITSFAWTIHNPSGAVTLTGPTPTHVFTHEGVYDVTLNVTDVLGITAQDTVRVTVGPSLDLTFVLTVGPIVDSKGMVMEGATVRMTMGRDVYSNTTDAAGMARIVLPVAAIGPDVWVSVLAKGYATSEYTTTITSGRTLSQLPGAMVEKKDTTGGGGGLSTGLVAGLVLVLVLVLIIVLLVLMRRRARPAGDEAPEAKLEGATVDEGAENELEDIERELSDDGTPAGRAEPGTAPGEGEEHVVSRPVTHQRGRGRAPPKAVPEAPKGDAGLKEREAEAEIEVD